jgi:AraC-like DNA-binding protein/mannose-6-phosphate isomerase-like protein (cupin superfamily)
LTSGVITSLCSHESSGWFLVTDSVERFTVASLLRPEASVRVMRPQLQQVDVHWHDFYELCVVIEGFADHLLNGVRHRIGPGDAFITSPSDFHALHTIGSEPLTCYNTVIDADAMEEQLETLGVTGAGVFPWIANDFQDALPDFERLLHEFDNPAPGSTVMASAILTTLLVELTRRCAIDDGPAVAPGPLSSGAVRRAMLYIDRHFREPLTLAEAAGQAHLSPNYFSERFRECTGSSFQTYLQDRRLRFARSLLVSTSLGVTEVCHAAGFHDLSHFGRSYRRRYGEAPSARGTEKARSPS